MELSKKCTKCKKDKPFNFFYSHKGRKNGTDNRCKCCSKLYHRSLDAMFRKCYMHSLRRIEREFTYQNREHTLTWEQWLVFKPKYFKLYKKWKEKSYKPSLTPSIDRINNSKGYTFDNIQVITMGENTRKENIGDTNNNAKLKDFEVMAIRALKKANKNLSNVQLAKMFNVTNANIGFIIKKTVWKHLPEPILL